MHRWYAIVYFGDEILGVIGTIPDDGLALFESVDEWERVTL
jgi:hypothetical protein